MIIDFKLRIRVLRSIALCKSNLFYVAAYLWRRCLWRTTVIAITGSVGKTTTKELAAALLATKGSVVKTEGNNNARPGLYRSVLRARWHHRYLLVEAPASHGGMKGYCRILKPDIVVQLSIRRIHLGQFGSIESIAAEKAKLSAALVAGGINIINIYEPLIVSEAAKIDRRQVSFGLSETADFRLLEASAVWPEPLSMTVCSGAATYRIKTALFGGHWAQSVMAAVAVGEVCGVRAEDIGHCLAAVKPFPARMQPATLASGAVIVRDDYNGALDTYLPAVGFMKQAQAVRKFAVFGYYLGTDESGSERAAALGAMAAEFAHAAIFIGEHSAAAKAAAVAGGIDQAHCFAVESTAAATRILSLQLRAGDLLLLKGRNIQHLARVFLGLEKTVTCVLPRCNWTFLCDDCDFLDIGSVASESAS